MFELQIAILGKRNGYAPERAMTMTLTHHDFSMGLKFITGSTRSSQVLSYVKILEVQKRLEKHASQPFVANMLFRQRRTAAAMASYSCH